MKEKTTKPRKPWWKERTTWTGLLMLFGAAIKIIFDQDLSGGLNLVTDGVNALGFGAAGAGLVFARRSLAGIETKLDLLLKSQGG